MPACVCWSELWCLIKQYVLVGPRPPEFSSSIQQFFQPLPPPALDLHIIIQELFMTNHSPTSSMCVGKERPATQQDTPMPPTVWWTAAICSICTCEQVINEEVRKELLPTRTKTAISPWERRGRVYLALLHTHTRLNQLRCTIWTVMASKYSTCVCMWQNVCVSHSHYTLHGCF